MYRCYTNDNGINNKHSIHNQIMIYMLTHKRAHLCGSLRSLARGPRPGDQHINMSITYNNYISYSIQSTYTYTLDIHNIHQNYMPQGYTLAYKYKPESLERRHRPGDVNYHDYDYYYILGV